MLRHQQVQAIPADEQNRRRAFYEWMDEDMKAEFINGEIVVPPAVEKHNAVVIRLGMLLSAFVDTRELGMARVEKALVTRNSYDRTANAAGYLLLRSRKSSYYTA